MNLDEILEGLSADNKEEKKSQIQSLIEESGREKISKVNQEASNIRKRFKKSWVDLGLDPDSEEFEVALMDAKKKLTEFDDLKAGKSKEKETELTQLQKKVEALTASIEQERKEKKEIARSSLIKSVEGELKSQLSKYKAISPDVLSKALIGDLNLDGDDLTLESVRFKGEDGLTISDGVKKFLDENKTLVSSQVSSGSDSSASKEKQGSQNSDANSIQARKEYLRQKTSNGL